MPNLNRFVAFTSDKLISLKNASSVSIIRSNSIMNSESFGEKVKKFWQCATWISGCVPVGLKTTHRSYRYTVKTMPNIPVELFKKKRPGNLFTAENHYTVYIVIDGI